MLKLILIRHFATYGNQLKRYIGITDEELWEEAIPNLDQVIYPEVEAVYVSPLTRCRQTARIIYPKIAPVVCEDFKECNFGEFENKNYLELSDHEKYQEWINSEGTMAFPGGEDVLEFKKRCILEFQKVIDHSLKEGHQAVAIVVHGGTIMSILEHFSDTRQDYYYWHVENGGGYIAEYEEREGRLINICNIH
jgi:alpha-ribazole phosphatase